VTAGATESDKASEASPPPEIADDQQWRLSLHQILTEKLKPFMSSSSANVIKGRLRRRK